MTFGRSNEPYKCFVKLSKLEKIDFYSVNETDRYIVGTMTMCDGEDFTGDETVAVTPNSVRSELHEI